MDFDDERFKYFPAVESATIQDSTPKAIANGTSETQTGRDPLEPAFDLGLIGSDDFIAHALSREMIMADVPGDGNLMDGISQYVDEMYSDSVGFDVQEDVKLKRYNDGEASLDVDLHYETDADFVSDVSLPGSLTVMGEVRDKYQDELEEYTPAGRY
ncbi:MAG: hypothetical protein ABEJ36_03390 [Candidatus Nanosalina sp.]